jgi:hypothetical protein
MLVRSGAAGKCKSSFEEVDQSRQALKWSIEFPSPIGSLATSDRFCRNKQVALHQGSLRILGHRHLIPRHLLRVRLQGFGVTGCIRRPAVITLVILATAGADSLTNLDVKIVAVETSGALLLSLE